MKIVTLFLSFFLLHASAGVHAVPEGPGESLAKIMKKGEIYATPRDQHRFLEQMQGKWKTSSVVMETEPQFGFSDNTMILGGRFLEMNYGGAFLGLKLEGKVTLGYDNYKNKFTVVYIDNLNTSIRTAEGLLDHTGAVLTLWGTMDEWLTDEHDKPVMYKYELLDQQSFQFEVHDLSLAPRSTKVISVRYIKQ